jgi:hypothetical protein
MNRDALLLELARAYAQAAVDEMLAEQAGETREEEQQEADGSVGGSPQTQVA